MIEVKQIGNIMPTKNRDNPNQGRVYDINNLSPALNCFGGGGREPMIVEPVIVASRGRNPENPSDRTPGNYVKQRLDPNSEGICNCITSVQKDCIVLEPRKTEIKEGEIYGKLIALSDTGKKQGTNHLCKKNIFNEPAVLVKQATKDGYAECKLGGVADLSYPTSKTRRGRVQDNGDTCPTLTATETGVCRIETHYRIRKLCPIETWRLMGFTDEDFHKAEKVNSNTQLYKQAGNSIVVPVLENIFKQLF